ncbi:hypothetical protein CCMSSC00406_0009483 [Pleurotus cornucopiae]|uniref:Uncharacterized protein n=1 Tax=Pleurotus cornucopiae TaxID=5321 RepID=A0ACB7IUV2_PLECO|nr:hypothetical protein CCMSSC00406_0009483 [Pleurotus cornucopiae]
MVQITSLAVAASLASYACAGPIDDLINRFKIPLASEKLQNDIKLSALQSHARSLQRFADRSNGTRVFGSQGHNESVDYVAKLARLAGYEVQRQTFPFPYSEVLSQRFEAGSPINISAMTFSPSTPLGGLTAPLVHIPDADTPPSAGCTPADFEGIDATGKIALIQRGECSFAIKNQNAKAAGAVGVVVYNNADGSLSGTLGDPNAAAFVPIGGISRAAGEDLVTRLASGQTIDATLDINIFNEDRYSSNVIATSKAGDKSNIVFIGSHLDSVRAGAGINDNGSGSIAILELAVQLSKYRLKNAVRFAWWTAEEFGLVGSEHYVANLSEEERKKIALYINLDMVASPNYVHAVLDGDGSSGLNPGPTPPGSGAIEKVFTDYYASKKIPSVPSAFNGRSDYGPFIAEGINIPSGGIFTGAEGIKTEEQAKLFGGSAGVAYDVNYHGAGDSYDNLNFKAFEANAKAAAHAVATFVASTAVVEKEKTLTVNPGLRLASVPNTLPNDALGVQGKDFCTGELA